ncbi:MAG: hypothetical protein A2946_01230 [Candidatus Liptonbacteria bacterium RIFCSPLOWO2_01_FULL_53_13]|uniref:Uncharacterized protein n=1 Tax=Candidatus Liptonbacteria bacterium RIFCSPLOWO2_01_FULL_53_13 TaxID=1798651 RepID=A0A1G2CP74_9BACT|nr:MAG: hypothetical protein A2946_01230 [Candidatus Liptonbacteria bacterium RIFCSPLOWO2_01_FULL_53_13]
MNKQISNGVNPQILLTKKERKDLKRQGKLEVKEASAQKRRLKKIASWGLGGGLTVALIGGLIWYVVTRPPVPESDIVSRGAFHWHPGLTIYVKGEQQEIPANIGIGAVHRPIHTHDDSGQGIVHMEFQGLARKQDTTLGQFFENWNKDMRSFGTNMKMTVNGEENTEYGNYVMGDKDKIELRFD